MLLVTGITGHTGKYFYNELVENKYASPIRCLIRETTDISHMKSSELNIEYVRGNINNEQFLESCMEGVENIVHIYNIHNSLSIVKLAIKYNVKKVVLVHTTGIYSEFKEASARYKEIERELKNILEKNKQINVVILRPSMIYGDICDHNISKFIKLIDTLKIVPIIDRGKSLIQPVNARDLGKSYYIALTKIEGQVEYDLTGDRPISMRTVYKLIAENLNKKIYVVSIPLSIGVAAAKVIKVLSFNKVNVVEKVQRMAENRSYSHEKATKDFQYMPIKFEDGLSIEVKQYLQSKREVKK